MRNELHQIEEIEQYLEGKMRPDERTVFENRMHTDENLKNQVQLQEQLTQRIQVNAFRNEVLNFHATYTETVAIGAKMYRFYFNALFLFGVLGLAAVSVYYLWPAGTKNQNVSLITRNEDHAPTQNKTQNFVSGTTMAAEKNPNEPAAVVRPDHPTKNKSIREVLLPAPLIEEMPCRSFLLDYLTQFIDASMGGEVVTQTSRSVIHFPGGILTDQQGNEVTGMVEIKYKEYRNAAEMALSQIPMVYSEKGKNYRFNSAGMFEVRAFQNGEELKMKPGAAFEIDYQTTGDQDSAFIFAMDKVSSWKKVEPIKFAAPEPKPKKQTLSLVNLGKGQVFVKVKDARTGENLSARVFSSFVNPAADKYMSNIIVDSGYNVSAISPGIYDIQLDMEGYRKMKMTQVKVFEGRITYVDAVLAPEGVKYEAVGNSESDRTGEKKEKRQKRGFHLFNKQKATEYQNDYIVRLSGDKTVALNQKEKDKITDLVKKETDKKEADKILGYTDAGHYFPQMIKGLKCESFGVYNCAQIHVLRSPIQVAASYKNTSGEYIRDAYLVSMIDLNYNGAFSFEPGHFICSSKDENVLILFTRSNKVYALPATDFKKMNLGASGKYTFIMTDITDTVKNSEDLRQYLGLKK